MKGGALLTWNRTKAPSVSVLKTYLQTLHEKIDKDTTFELAGGPLSPELYQNTTKPAALAFITSLYNINQLSNTQTTNLDAYMEHYNNRQVKESTFQRNMQEARTEDTNTPYIEMREKAQTLLQHLQNKNDDTSEETDWLKKYITFLDNFTYFSYTQAKKITDKLSSMEP